MNSGQDYSYQEKILLASVLQTDLQNIFLENYTLQEDSRSEYQEKLALLRNGYPLDYLLGKVTFFGKDFLVNQNTLIPRAETEEMVANLYVHFSAKSDFKDFILVDTGCGSGIIGVSLAGCFKQVLFSDISGQALQVARQNAKTNQIANCLFYESNLLEFLVDQTDLIKSGEKWVLVTNLPYLPEKDRIYKETNKVEYEPEIALYAGTDGLDLFKKLCNQLKILKQKNILPVECYFELDPRNIETAQLLLSDIYDNTVITKDYNNLPRVLSAKLD